MQAIMRRYALLFSFLFLPLAAAELHAQSITMTPGYVTVGVGGKVQYSAAVTGLQDMSVTWLVSGVKGGNAQSGRMSPSGVYTAPQTVPANDVTITAVGSDKKTYAIEYVKVANIGPAISGVTPNPAPIGEYTITLAGSGFKPGVQVIAGGINLPVTFQSSTKLRVTGWQGAAAIVAFMAQNPGTLVGAGFPVPFATGAPTTISPATVMVVLGGSQLFTSAGATSWTASAGSISANGLYTAPTVMASPGTVTITAKGASGSGSATVTLVAPQTISPASVSVAFGGAEQFTSIGATSWTATAGSVSATGLYTAPTGGQSAQVTATGPGGSATATIGLTIPAPVITAVGNGQLPLGVYSTTITGTGFTSGTTAQMNGQPIASAFNNGALSISGFTRQSGSASVTVTNGSTVSAPFPVQVGVQNALASAAAARRFLEQAAFGPTPSEANHLQTIGMQAWLGEQFQMPQTSSYNSVTGTQGGMPPHFLMMAVTNADQLRQRVAFALSQIFVASFDKITWDQDMVPFESLLLTDAFANYRQIMEDVTLNPAMGNYLDMANNSKANPAAGSVANENYARELMQLFSLGTNLLNTDGSVQMDRNGVPIATYSQFNVMELARVLTGWTYTQPAGTPVRWNAYITENGNLMPDVDEHDFGSKQLLNGYVSPAAASPQQDLDNALDNIFNHPNVGPFVGRQLIQHLVKSNPSLAYVGRVAAAFNDNGQGVRGDMKAVIAAVLLDPEARANDEGGKDQIADGHLQEPGVFLAGMVRAFGGQMTDGNYYATELAAMGQDLFSSPSVFNYYAPGYGVPGTSLQGGEFQIHTPNNAIIRANEVSTLFSQYANPMQSYGPGTSLDLSAFLPLAATPGTLVDALDLTLTHGVMPSGMKTAIVAAVTADSGSSLHQVQTASYLILTSTYYNVWH